MASASLDQAEERAAVIAAADSLEVVMRHGLCVGLCVVNVHEFLGRVSGGTVAGVRFTVLTAAAAASSANAAQFIPLGDFAGGPFESRAAGVSDDGSVVVGTGMVEGSMVVSFRWTQAGGMTAVASPEGWMFSYVNDVSGNGLSMAGMGLAGEGLKVHYAAALWRDAASPVSLEPQLTPLAWNMASDLSSDGAIVVGTDNAGWDFDPAFSTGDAFRYDTQTGRVQYLPDLAGFIGFFNNCSAAGVSADGMVIVGYGTDSTGVKAVRWIDAGLGFQPQVLGQLQPQFGESYATAVSANGQVIGGHAATATGYQPFRWTTSAGMVSLGTPPPKLFTGSVTAISGDGSIMLGSWNASLYPYFDADGVAFIWDAAHGMRDLQSVLQDVHGLDLRGWRLTATHDITPDGQTLVGVGINPSGNMEAWVARLASTPADPADLDQDGDVDGFDLAILLGSWGRCAASRACPADLDDNSLVNGFDLAQLLASWTFPPMPGR